MSNITKTFSNTNDDTIDKNERILCAAITVSIAEGKPLVISGYSHKDCYNIVRRMMKDKYFHFESEGFLTSTDRFVDCVEAKIIAEQANQLIRNSRFRRLAIEDIY